MSSGFGFGPGSQNSAADVAAGIIGNKLNESGAEGDGCRWGFRIGGLVLGGAAGYGAGMLVGGGGAAAGGAAGAAGGPAGAAGGAAAGAGLAAVGLAIGGAALGYQIGKDVGDNVCGGPSATPAGPAAPAAPAVDEGTYIGEVDDPNFVNGGNSGESAPTTTDNPAPTDTTGPEATDPTEPDSPEPAPAPDGGLPPDDASGTSSGPGGPRSDFMPADDSVGGGTPRSYGANLTSLATAPIAGLQLIALAHTQIS